MISVLLAGATKVEHNPVLNLHQGFANVFLLYTVFMAIWGFFLWSRNSKPSANYLGALVLDEGVAVLQGLIGLILVLQGHRPGDALHYLYGVIAVLTLPVAYFFGNSATERRDSLIFGVAALFLAGIAIRGITTGGT